MKQCSKIGGQLQWENLFDCFLLFYYCKGYNHVIILIKLFQWWMHHWSLWWKYNQFSSTWNKQLEYRINTWKILLWLYVYHKRYIIDFDIWFSMSRRVIRHWPRCLEECKKWRMTVTVSNKSATLFPFTTFWEKRS